MKTKLQVVALIVVLCFSGISIYMSGKPSAEKHYSKKVRMYIITGSPTEAEKTLAHEQLDHLSGK